MKRKVHARLQPITDSLEFEVDKVAESTHVITQYRVMADKLAADALQRCAAALDERDKRAGHEEKAIGTREVLRSLSRFEQ